ncbi:hypothetical protein [Catenibacterium mitsuokai]|uniref:restriction endonuclease subunit S n=1 Tax=Catenibacterium mitsuokai TaxID=100886 RepID=UPI002E791164|nr:hypothetical protein [Catenibacterium tridentinum]
MSRCKLEEFISYEQPSKYIVNSDQYDDSFEIPVLTAGKSFILGYTDETNNIFDNLPVIIFDDFTTSVQFVDFPFKVKSSAMKLLKNTEQADIKYCYYLLKFLQHTPENHKRQWLSATSQNIVELPTIEKQKNIVRKLDKILEVIDNQNKQLELLDEAIKARFVEMFGDPEDNPFKWDKMPLSNIMLNANNGMARRGNDENGNIVLRLVELQDGYINYSNPNRICLNENEKKRYLLKNNDFLFARVNGNPDNVGRCAVFHDIGEDVYHNDHIIRVHFNEELLNGVFASELINSNFGKRQLKKRIKTSAGQYTVSQDGIGAIVSIVPPLELQNQFASFVKEIDKSRLRELLAIKHIKLLLNDSWLLFY